MNKTTSRPITVSVKVGVRHQVVIPQKIARRLRIEEGTFLEAREEDGAIVLRPQIMIPREDAWFWSPEWQAKEREADADLAAGRISGPFTTAKELIKSLKSK